MKIDFLPIISLALFATCFAQTDSIAELPITIGTGVELSWPTSAGNSYQLQWASGPEETGPWTDIGLDQPGTGSMQSSQQLTNGSSRYYRVVETVPASVGSVSAVVNGGFETGTGSSASNWIAGGSQPPVRTDSDVFTGTNAIHSAVINAGASANTATLEQQLSMEGSSVVAGETYNFSFQAKQVSFGVSYVQQYDLQWLNSSGSFISSTGLVAFTGGNNTWTKVSVAGLVAPVGATDARVFFRFVTGAIAGGEGEVYIDEVVLATDTVPIPGEVNVLTPTQQTMLHVDWDSILGVQYTPMVSNDLSDPEDWTALDSPIIGDGGPQSIAIPFTSAPVFILIRYPGEVSLEVVPLFNANTVFEPETTVETPTALITHVADRSRDRHAREPQFMAYDHYLTWYWEERTMAIEIIDEVAKGGTDITVNYTTLTPLSQPEFRAFFRGITAPAEYHFNLLAPLVGPNKYSATISSKLPENRPLQIGDRMEIEISMFLRSPMNGRKNYYGTAILYIVGQGIVPWQGIGNLLDSYPIPEEGWLGGQTTNHYQYSNEPDNVFKQTAGNIAPLNAQPFMLGRRSHHTDFGNGAHSEPGNPVYSEHIGKLGPKFIARSCVECHTNNGRSLPPAVGVSIVKSVVKVGNDASGIPHPILGKVLQPQATSGQPESSVFISSYTNTVGQYGDGTSYSLRQPNYSFNGTAPAYFSVRAAQQLVGLGLLEAVAEQTIVELADPDDSDQDGISGRIQTTVDPMTGESRLGRFTHKGAIARVGHQIAAALNNDMGVTTALFPNLDGESSISTPELADNDLDEMTRYVALLGVSARRDLNDSESLRGESLFDSAGCTDCHIPQLPTSPYHPMAELRNQTIRPYTDLLLHDMGPGLADNMGELNASGAEWRTAPLWSIGLTEGVSGGEAYLHDGRARTLEEAILWHGGEAEDSKEAFRTMTSTDRIALVKFLKSL